jgi:hypothetical protein
MQPLQVPDVEWTIGELCCALQQERALSAALIALAYRLAAELKRQAAP